MSLKLLIHYILWMLLTTIVRCHLPEYVSTPANTIDQFCARAETCIHDNIAICGLLDKEKRTFLDHCDLLEYACDRNQVYTHIEDTVGCPYEKKKD